MYAAIPGIHEDLAGVSRLEDDRGDFAGVPCYDSDGWSVIPGLQLGYGSNIDFDAVASCPDDVSSPTPLHHSVSPLKSPHVPATSTHHFIPQVVCFGDDWSDLFDIISTDECPDPSPVSSNSEPATQVLHLDFNDEASTSILPKTSTRLPVRDNRFCRIPRTMTPVHREMYTWLVENASCPYPTKSQIRVWVQRTGKKNTQVRSWFYRQRCKLGIARPQRKY